MTSDPSYEDAQPTPPMLIAADAAPSLRQPIIVKTKTPQVLGASVVSEDNGQLVRVHTYIDWGWVRSPAQSFPYLWPAQADWTAPTPGTLDEKRPFTVTWTPLEYPPDGCHTLTMIAAHNFDTNGCPSPLSDSDQLVWYVLVCDTDTTDCDTISLKSCDAPIVSAGGDRPIAVTPCVDATAGAVQ